MAQPRQQKWRSRQRQQSSTTCLSSSSATQRRRRSPSRWPTLSSGRGEQRRQSKPAGSSTCRAAQPSAMAQLLAVKRRAERALQHIGRCTDELAAHHRPKVARGARSRPGRTTPASLCTQLLVYKMPPIPLNCLKKLLRSHRIGFFSLQRGGHAAQNMKNGWKICPPRRRAKSPFRVPPPTPDSGSSLRRKHPLYPQQRLQGGWARS